MTREEEIKARFHERLAKHTIWKDGREDGSAEDDLEYLLARNEELQREKEKMEQAGKEVWDRSSLNADGDFIVRESSMMKLYGALYAKEQDDD